MKVVISNTVLLNAGDAAILQGILKVLNIAFGRNIEIIIYDSNPNVSSKYYPELTFRKTIYNQIKCDSQSKYFSGINLIIRRNLFYFSALCLRNQLTFLAKIFVSEHNYYLLEDYSSADMIISTGGTYLVENYSLEARIYDYKISLLLKRPLVFFTQSLGPFTKKAYRRNFKKIFNKSILILLRDQRSQTHIRDLGVKNTNIHVISDAAFVLAKTKTLQESLVEPQNQYLKVAISVREWKYFKTIDPLIGKQQYKQAICKAVEHLVLKHEAKITFISTCQGISEYWTDDSDFASEIFAELPNEISNSISIDSSFHQPEKLAIILKNFDLVIATRLHMAILALGVDVPVLAIAYEFKTLELYKKLNQDAWVLDIESINNDLIVSRLDKCLASFIQDRISFSKAVEKEKESAISAHELLSQAYIKWKKDDK